MTLLRNEWIGLIVRVFLGVVFIYAAVLKIVDPHDFAKDIYNFRLLPDSLVNLFALFLPWLELLTGVALILGTKVEGASTLVGAMLLLFIVAVAISMMRGLSIECGCFSKSSVPRLVGLTLLLEDTGLFLCALYVWIYGPGRWALDRRGLREC